MAAVVSREPIPAAFMRATLLHRLRAVMVLATFTDSVAFQLIYPLVVIPPSAWYGHWYTTHRVPPPQPHAPPPPPNLGPSSSSGVTIEHHEHYEYYEQHEHHHHHYPAARQQQPRDRSPSASSDDDWWVAPVLLLAGAALTVWLIARGYAAARGTLVSILLVGGVPAVALTAGAYVGLYGRPEFRTSLRFGLIAAALAQALCVVNAYLLLHPSWTGGNYEQAFQRFLKRGATLADAFSDQQDDVTFFLAYQGLGAILGIVALVLAILSAFAISEDAERAANGAPGFLRRAAAWLLSKGPGSGVVAAWGALVLAGLGAALCSGIIYNAFGRPQLKLPTGPPAVTAVDIRHNGKRVVARFSLDEGATVTMRVRRLQHGQAGRVLNAVSKQLRAGRHRLGMPARRDGRALRSGLFRVELRARGSDGRRSSVETATFRVK